MKVKNRYIDLFFAGYLPERIIGLQDIPEGTSVEMVEVMFPLSEVAEITYIKSGKGEVTG